MIKFTKMQGLGNDFIVIDTINQSVQLSTEQIQQMADRNFGIGFDQLLLVEKPMSDNAEFKYRIFNADGGEVAQCGNGARCFARFVIDKGLTTHQHIIVDTNSGQLQLDLTPNGLVTVNMGVPQHAPADIPLNTTEEAPFYKLHVDNTEQSFSAVSMGNPHAVLHVDNLDTAPVTPLGRALEGHSFFPERANIGFMEIINRQHIKLRVYERGTAETLACGSGACAAVVTGIENNMLDKENIKVDLLGGELLISWQGRGYPVFMTGPAKSVFEGQINL